MLKNILKPRSFPFHKTNNIFYKVTFYNSYYDTIFALSSGLTKAGVSIIRVSGSDAFKSLNLIHNKTPVWSGDFTSLKDLPISSLRKLKPTHAYHRKFYSILDKKEGGERGIIDEGLILLFAEPKSFTGENTVEFHTHGSRAVQAKFLEELASIENFRMAESGEFTKRAFFNGKMDLMKVEGLSDLINAETEAQRAQSLNHYLGSASEVLEGWRKTLIQCLAHAEAYIDFEEHEEDVGSDVYDKVAIKIQGLIEEMQFHLNNKNRGEILRDGLYIVIFLGPPNAGKSSLMNLLAQRKVAIVSDTPGTTRDVLTVSLNLNGYPVRISDTAGIRESMDTIEQEGVELALEQIKESNLNLMILDVNDVNIDLQNKEITPKDPKQFKKLESSFLQEKTVILLNKSDTLGAYDTDIKNFPFKWNGVTCQIFQLISCKQNQGVQNFIEKIADQIKKELLTDSAEVETNSLITKARHRLELEACVEHLERFCTLRQSIEISCEELRCALQCIGRLTGRIDVEEILDVLFRDFCIGK